MAIVTLDCKEGYSASHDLLTGWDYTRIAMVEDLAYGGSTDDLITQAEAALSATYDPSPGSITGVVGQRGSKYNMGSGGVTVYLKAFVPDVVGPNSVEFRIVYRGYPILVYEFDGSLNQIEANIDVNQNPIAVSYTYNSSYGTTSNGGDSNKANHRYVQSVLVQRDEPEPVFTVRFLVVTGNLSTHVRGQDLNLFNANATDCMTAIGSFSGTCNDDTYTIGIITGTKHQWKIVRVTGVSRDQGLTYEASMSFQFRPSGWDKTVTFINPDTGQPPPDLVVSTVKVTDPAFPQYAGIPPTATPDIGSTIAATADESTFPSFGDAMNATFPLVKN